MLGVLVWGARAFWGEGRSFWGLLVVARAPAANRRLPAAGTAPPSPPPPPLPTPLKTSPHPPNNTPSRPERLHYLGVSFGLTQPLYNFWSRAGFRPLYLRQSASETTGEHTAVMVGGGCVFFGGGGCFYWRWGRAVFWRWGPPLFWRWGCFWWGGSAVLVGSCRPSVEGGGCIASLRTHAPARSVVGTRKPKRSEASSNQTQTNRPAPSCAPWSTRTLRAPPGWTLSWRTSRWGWV